MNLLPVLLADPSPCLRILILRELFHRPKNDPEVQELQKLMTKDPLVYDLLNLQEEDGSWVSKSFTYSTYTDKINTTSMVLMKLGFLGFDSNFPNIQKGIEFLFSHQKSDGSWPIPSSRQKKIDGGYSMIPLQTAFPLRGISYAGFAEDKRAERAYKWLLDRQLDDGAWPAGLKVGTKGFIAGYRKIPHSRWGCRSNTSAVLSALAMHPKFRSIDLTKKALDLLLTRETKERHSLGFEVARLIGVEPFRGYFTHYAKFDIAFILNLCWRIGASKNDDRISDFVDFVLENQGEYGLWQYLPKPLASRWITFDLLRSLTRLDENTDWLTFEPRTPFTRYPKQIKRF